MVFGHNALLAGVLEVNGAASGVCSQTPSCGDLLPPLGPEITVVVCPTTYRPCQNYPVLLTPTGGAAQAAVSCKFWEGTVIKHLGTAQSIWQWQQQGKCAPSGVRGTRDVVLSQCLSLWCPLRWLGLQVIFVQVSPVRVGHSHLWSQR